MNQYPLQNTSTTGLSGGFEALWAASYRFGFNGKESDSEVKGEGNQQDYGMRIYDNRLGRFLSVDPLTKKFPYYTPYQYAGNRPIACIDLDGLEDLYYNERIVCENDNSVLQVLFESNLKEDLEKFSDITLNKGFDIVIIENSSVLNQEEDARTFLFSNKSGIPDNKYTKLADQSVIKEIEAKGRGVILVFIRESKSINDASLKAELGNWD